MTLSSRASLATVRVVPAAIVLGVCWLVFLPVAHALTFAPGQGWFSMGRMPSQDAVRRLT